ncbi:MAG: hypothetical protein K2X93_15335 [Candidatus Obscuribacterales bacterium]|nr:hypothetical protein [Candidatus Obscuribacterales bacterium]
MIVDESRFIISGGEKSTSPSSGCSVATEISTRERELLARIEQLEVHNSRLEEKGKQLAQELDMFRQRRLVYWSDRFRNKFDAWHLMHPAYEQLKDDTIIFGGDLKDYRLLPSLNLVRMTNLRYEINLGRAGLHSLLLAPVVDMPSNKGKVCIRLVSQTDEVVCESSVSIADLDEEQPCRFSFSALGAISEKPLVVYVFIQNADVPIRIFEMRKYPLGGFARLKRQIFAGYCFDDDNFSG